MLVRNINDNVFFAQIRIRDPNQGGRDITEEIMSGGRSASTPPPPQVTHFWLRNFQGFLFFFFNFHSFLPRASEMFFFTISNLSQTGCASCVPVTYLLTLSFSPQSILPLSEGGAITQSNSEKATPPVIATRAGKEDIKG